MMNQNTDLVPKPYHVILSKDGYYSQIIFSGTKEECREFIKLLNRECGKWYYQFLLMNDRNCKYLKDGFAVRVTIDSNVDWLDIKKYELDWSNPPQESGVPPKLFNSPQEISGYHCSLCRPKKRKAKKGKR